MQHLHTKFQQTSREGAAFSGSRGFFVMRKKIKYQKGQPIGDRGCVFLFETETRIRPGGGKDRRAMFKCGCGNEFESSIGEIKAGKTSSCGCVGIIKYKNGQILGDHGAVFLRELDRYISPKGFEIRIARFKCGYCGSNFETGISRVKSSHTTSCGCEQRRRTSLAKKTHGMSDTPIYHTWKDIKDRCFNKKNDQYHGYGGRGIVMCEEWRNDFMVFYNYVSKLYGYENAGLTLDRENNNGNYEPGNVRWATVHTQNANQGLQSNNTSGYAGVCFRKDTGKWVASIRINGKSIYIGAFNSKLAAAEARDRYIIKNGLWEYPLQVIGDPRIKTTK